MTPRIRAAGLFVSLWIAMTLAAAARAAVVDDVAMALLATLFWMAVQGAGLWFAHANDGPPPPKVTEVIAGVGLLAFVVELMSAGLVQALMSLLLWLQAARNPVLRTRRDAYFALAIGLTLVMFGGTEARGSAYLVVLAGFGFAAMVVLVYCHQQRGLEAEVGDGAIGVPEMRSLPLAHVGALTLIVFAIASLWYLLVPRPQPLNFGAVATRGGDKYESDEWEREAKGEKRPTPPPARAPQGGASPRQSPAEKADELDITRTGQNRGGQPANAIVMYVQADGPLYLRERTFDRFQGDRWDRTDERTQKLLASERQFRLWEPNTGTPREYVVEVVLARSNAIPLSAQAKRLVAPVPVVALGKDGAVYLPARLERGFRYSAVSMFAEGEERPIAYDKPADLRPYLQLPYDYSERIGELAREVTRDASSPLAKAIALESHLRSAYQYSFDTVFTSQNVTPLDDFLFVSKRGHCEFFASAMAIMLRSVGIASRVVHGFLAQNYNPVTGFYEVRAFDGHAWVEGYVEGRGWVTFEATPAYPVPRRQDDTGTTLKDLKEYTQKLAEQDALTGVAGLSASVAEAVRRLAETWQGLVLRSRLAAEGLRAWLAANAVVVIAVLAALAAAIAVGYRKRAALAWWLANLVVRATPAGRIPLVVFREIERVARVRNLGRPPGETADEYLSRLQGEHPSLHGELETLRREFNAARYDGRRPDAAAATSILEAFRAIGAELAP